MKWCSGEAGRGDHLFKRLDTTRRLLYSSVTQVDMTRRVEPSRHAKHFQDLPVRSLWHVLNAKADSECTTLQTSFKSTFHLGDFTRRGCSSRGLTGRQKLGLVFHRRHSRGEVPGADTVVDEGF